MALVRVWKPVESPDLHSSADSEVGTNLDHDGTATPTVPGRAATTATRVGGGTGADSGGDIARAYAPYIIISIAIFSIANITSVKTALEKAPWSRGQRAIVPGLATPVYVCRGVRSSWQAIWPDLRRLRGAV